MKASVSTMAREITFAAKSRKTLRAAHEAAAEYHQAMADAHEAEGDVEDYQSYMRDGEHEWTLSIREAEKRQAAALAKAWLAFQKMPVAWTAIMNAHFDAVQQREGGAK